MMDVKETINNVKAEVEEKIKNIDIKDVAEKVKESGIKGFDDVKEKAGEIIGNITGKADKK